MTTSWEPKEISINVYNLKQFFDFFEGGYTGRMASELYCK